MSPKRGADEASTVGDGLAPPDTFDDISLSREEIDFSVGYGIYDVPQNAEHFKYRKRQIGIYVSVMRVVEAPTLILSSNKTL